MKNILKKNKHISLFSEKPLVGLVSLVTLLLQLISFATTWNGSKIYLEGVFPYAALFFAIAIQAFVYFFSNSLRGRLGVLRIIALCAALCCSTYYSYIGIYNSVNTPAAYLQERYESIRQELSQAFWEELEGNLSSSREVINEAASLITAEYTSLMEKQQTIDACYNALEEVETSLTDDMRPPNRYNYESYEDYAAAYQAYINSAALGSNTENEAARSNLLSSYGFTTMEQLNTAKQNTTAEIMALKAALNMSAASSTDVLTTISTLSAQLNTAINASAMGEAFSAGDTTSLNRLLQAGILCGMEDGQQASVINTINRCAEVSSSDFMKDFVSLVECLPQKAITSANTMELKSLMDSEILSAILKLNSLLSEPEQLSPYDSAWEITDLYLIPIKALQNEDTKLTAFFSLAVAALIDMLSVLFAISLRPRKPLWKKRTLAFSQIEDYEPFIRASLPQQDPLALQGFLAFFQPSPSTEGDGYMLMAPLNTLNAYSTLTALLCQVNLAKVLPPEFSESNQEHLLLRARFVFWANSVIYDYYTNENNKKNEVAYE